MKLLLSFWSEFPEVDIFLDNVQIGRGAFTGTLLSVVQLYPSIELWLDTKRTTIAELRGRLKGETVPVRADDRES